MNNGYDGSMMNGEAFFNDPGGHSKLIPPRSPDSRQLARILRPSNRVLARGFQRYSIYWRDCGSSVRPIRQRQIWQTMGSVLW